MSRWWAKPQRCCSPNFSASAYPSRICITHARWDQPDVSLEELLIALADKLWQGKHMSTLEERVIDSAAARILKQRWDLFVALDACFEAIADEGSARLSRSLLEGEEPWPTHEVTC